jgi:uncharacterized membrane protein
MPLLLRIPLGLVIMVIGFLIVLKTETVYTWFGDIQFAEDKLGTGMSRFFYKIMGILITFIGIFVATNVISDILGSAACFLTNCK